MAKPMTRSEFAEYCLRKLGKPVINIEVTDEQVDDRIDEALSYYHDYHFDGSNKMYLKHQVTADDKTNKWIDIPEEVNGVIGIFPVGSSFSSVGMFDVRYQFALNEMVNLATFSLVDYYMTYQNIMFMQELLVGRAPVRYNRHENKLYIDMNWNKIEVGEWIIIEVSQIIDPEEYSDVWSDRWLQNYATQKIKLQWGENLSKFAEGVLPGGIRFNAEKIVTDANAEILRLEERMQWDNQLPPGDMIG